MNQNAIYIDYLECFVKALFRVRARVSVIKRRRNFFVFAFFQKITMGNSLYLLQKPDKLILLIQTSNQNHFCVFLPQQLYRFCFHKTFVHWFAIKFILYRIADCFLDFI